MQTSGRTQMLKRRGTHAAVDGIHRHRLRHAFVHQWLCNGGAEGDLMSIAGRRTARQPAALRGVGGRAKSPRRQQTPRALLTR